MDSARRENPVTPVTLFLVSAVLAVVFLALAYFQGNNDTTGFLVSVAVWLVLAGAVFFWLWGRLETRPAYWSLILGVVAIVSLVAFWLGLPFVFGLAAVGLGLRDAAGEARSKVGIALGAVAVVAGALACAFG
ncbi:MAG: hypothetical protein QOJ13_444 [Gaiellales bacterium]|nr:hypothetical protein [Gaiellales bacterium]